MTIGYVLKMYPRFSETFIVNEILELERRGVDIRIYALRKPDDGRFHANLAQVRAPVTYLPESLLPEKERVLTAQRSFLHSRPRVYARVLWYALAQRNRHALKRFFQAVVLAEHLRAQPVEYLHAHFASSATRVAMFVHLLTGLPFSFTAHAKDIFTHDVDSDLLRDKMRLARFVVTVSEFNRQYLAQLASQPGRTGLGALCAPGSLALSPQRIRRMYNGVDLKVFDGRRPGARNAEIPVVLSIGRLVEKKGLVVLVRACALLRERGMRFRAELIGKGPLESMLGALIAELGLQSCVTLLGPQSQAAVVAAYRRADVFALPCVVAADGNRDGLPTVLLEAMAMCVPVVSTRLTGVPEIIDDGENGSLVPPNDPAALADALGRLLANPALCTRMGQAARQKVQRDFDLAGNVAVLRQWFLEVPEPARAGEMFGAVAETAPAWNQG